MTTDPKKERTLDEEVDLAIRVTLRMAEEAMTPDAIANQTVRYFSGSETVRQIVLSRVLAVMTESAKNLIYLDRERAKRDGKKRGGR
jgi:hypothetical protein